MSDKTEQPTPKRLRESREKGDVCKSQDVPSALTVLALSVYIVVMGRQLLESLPFLIIVFSNNYRNKTI